MSQHASLPARAAGRDIAFTRFFLLAIGVVLLAYGAYAQNSLIGAFISWVLWGYGTLALLVSGGLYLSKRVSLFQNVILASMLPFFVAMFLVPDLGAGIAWIGLFPLVSYYFKGARIAGWWVAALCAGLLLLGVMRHVHWLRTVFPLEDYLVVVCFLVFSSAVLYAFDGLRAKVERELEQHRDLLGASNASLASLVQDLHRLGQQKSDILAVVAHDLKAPLSCVRLALQAREKEGEMDSITRELLGSMQQEVAHMGEMVSRLLRQDQQAAAEGRLFDASAITAEVCDEFSPLLLAKQLCLHSALASHVFLFGDALAFREILENLISNAIKFSTPGAGIWVDLSEHLERVSLLVRDEGPGFSAEDRRRLFVKYAKLSARPTAGESSHGIGLSIVRQLADAWGASIVLESTHGRGASFYIDFPRPQRRAETAEE